jgi:hypothetical protein
MTHRSRLGLSGAIVALLYLLSASWTYTSGVLPVRPFFQGTGPPPPYRWVSPPPEFEDVNEPPIGHTEEIPFVVRNSTDGGKVRIFEGGTITSGDGQVSISVPSVSFEENGDDEAIRFTVEPLDPATLGEPPEGKDYDGNAIEVTATYIPSDTPAVPVQQDCTAGGCINVIMRFPTFGDTIYRAQTGGGWEAIPETQQIASSFQVYGPILELGTFVVGVVPHEQPTQGLRTIVAFIIGGVAVVGAVTLQRIRAKRSGPAPAKRGRTPKGESPRGRGSKGRSNKPQAKPAKGRKHRRR